MKKRPFPRRFAHVSSLVVPAFLAIACGGSPPPEAAPPAAPPKPAPVADMIDVSAVPEPTDLVVTAHLTKPSQDLKIVGGWTNLPMPGADDVADIVTDLDVGQLIDLDAPIDVAVAVEGRGKRIKPVFAVAVGVRPGVSPGSLKRVTSTPLGGGLFKLEARGRAKGDTGGGDGIGLEHEHDDDDDSGKICEVIPAFGPSSTRLVCGASEGAITALGPYLARTAPRAAYTSDLHVEARLDALRTTLEQARQLIPMLVGGLISDKGGPAVHDLVNAALGDLVDASLDLDRVKFDTMLTDAKGTATLTASFREAHSLITQIAVAHPERSDVPPPTFWHLPADSRAAFFGRGIDAKELDHPRELLVDAISKTLDQQALAPADRAAIADVVQQYFVLMSTPTVFANGFDAPAADAKKDDAKKDDKGKDKGEREHRHAFGDREEGAARGSWAVAGIDAPIAKVASIGKSVAAAMHRPGVAKLLKAQMSDGVPAPTFVVAPVSAKLGLPKDTVHLQLTVVSQAEETPVEETLSGPVGVIGKSAGKPAKPAKTPAKPKVKLGKPYVLHWYFVPDAGRTWVGYGADETIVASHLKVALSTSTDPGTLASRAGLDDLKNAKIGSGGFITIAGVLAPSPLEPILHSHDPDLARVFWKLRNAPQKGETPMPLLIRSIAPAGQGAGSLEMTMELPRETVRDLVAAAVGR